MKIDKFTQKIYTTRIDHSTLLLLSSATMSFGKIVIDSETSFYALNTTINAYLPDSQYPITMDLIKERYERVIDMIRQTYNIYHVHKYIGDSLYVHKLLFLEIIRSLDLQAYIEVSSALDEYTQDECKASIDDYKKIAADIQLDRDNYKNLSDAYKRDYNETVIISESLEQQVRMLRKTIDDLTRCSPTIVVNTSGSAHSGRLTTEEYSDDSSNEESDGSDADYETQDNGESDDEDESTSSSGNSEDEDGYDSMSDTESERDSEIDTHESGVYYSSSLVHPINDLTEITQISSPTMPSGETTQSYINDAFD